MKDYERRANKILVDIDYWGNSVQLPQKVIEIHNRIIETHIREAAEAATERAAGIAKTEATNRSQTVDFMDNYSKGFIDACLIVEEKIRGD